MALDVEVLKQFRIVFKSIRKHFQSIEDELGISGAQLWALAEIDIQPGLALSTLSKAMSLHQSTTSNLVEKLVVLGLVERKKSLEDGRSIRLFATLQGASKLRFAPRPVKGLLPDALERLSPTTLLNLHTSLSDLLVTMNKLEHDAGDYSPLSDHS
ncbi:MAG: MarR family winged helix-turn-helix transcriptional regulator [Deefgea sp.]